jgi:hypothetical protein
MDRRRHAGGAGDEQLSHVPSRAAYHLRHVGEADDVRRDLHLAGSAKGNVNS